MHIIFRAPSSSPSQGDGQRAQGGGGWGEGAKGLDPAACLAYPEEQRCPIQQQGPRLQRCGIDFVVLALSHNVICIAGFHDFYASKVKDMLAFLSKFNWWKISIMWLLGNRSISPPLTTLHFRIDKMLNTEHLDTILENDILEVLQKLRRSTRSWGKGVSARKI